MRLLIFTYAPAGLGHLRVADALVDSRPKDSPYVMLGSYDKFITYIHRLFSTNPVAKCLFLSAQYGLMEDLVTFVYRSILMATSEQIYGQLKEIISGCSEVDEIWVVATHFGIAHQVGAIKTKLMKESGKVIRLIVQVADDTSQHIWCVNGADLTFVPSLHAKLELEKYAKKHKQSTVFEVTPYPLSPVLTNKLDEINIRNKAFSSESDQINVAVPISGAFVGMSYLIKLISTVGKKSGRFKFLVVVKKSIYADMFLSSLAKLSNVNLITGRNDNEMISLYELMYQNNLMHLEITKPSEQAFKAILPPTLVGGSIMLFTTPVGRQEFENIDFLTRHGLMASSSDDIRAIRLSKDPKIAANFIIWGLDTGLFSQMSSSDFKFSEKALLSGEVGPDGAKEFWKTVEKYFVK